MSLLVPPCAFTAGRQPSRTYYQVLDISPDEQDPQVIEEAALRCSSHVRTYQLTRESECTVRLNEIAEGMMTLLDPVRRRAYDQSLGKPLSPALPNCQPPCERDTPVLLPGKNALPDKRDTPVLLPAENAPPGERDTPVLLLGKSAPPDEPDTPVLLQGKSAPPALAEDTRLVLVFISDAGLLFIRDGETCDVKLVYRCPPKRWYPDRMIGREAP